MRANFLGQAGRFAAEDEPVAGREARFGKRVRALGGEREHALGVGAFGFDQRGEGLVDLERGVFVVVEPGALQLLVVEFEAERLDEVELAAGVGGEADDVAGVGRDFGFDENDVQHAAIVVAFAVVLGLACARKHQCRNLAGARRANGFGGAVQGGTGGHHIVDEQHAAFAQQVLLFREHGKRMAQIAQPLRARQPGLRYRVLRAHQQVGVQCARQCKAARKQQ
ncbi:hypothetical protein SDC9_151392 [bioreactor metagenome]|uniref:Uncharacterized protein n=1 Tax=bioreactor metagenome TaxID=1076179 RepID=A0A645ERS8_9ZZZZ